MKRKMQVFVSSTFDDLLEERQAAFEAILEAGHIPAGMELFNGGSSTITTIKKWIKESDALILILGGKYGSLVNRRNRSYTQMEYELALSEGIQVCPLVLTDSFLCEKASKTSFEHVFEKNHIDKYNKFKAKVKSNGITKFPNNADQLKSMIISYLNELAQDNSKTLIGWVRGNNITDIDYANLTEAQIASGMKKMIAQVIANKHTKVSFEKARDTASNICSNFTRIVESPYGILESSERVVKLDLLDADEETLRVTITKTIHYYDLDYLHHPFRISFRANEQQANSYKTLSFNINGKNRIQDLQIMLEHNPERSQLQYRVFSNGVTLPSAECEIVHASSYECKPEDFFQSHRINCLCQKFNVHIVLNDLIRSRYDLIMVSFSPFSSRYDDEFETGEIITPYDNRISLPKWSLPGSGYVITLKKK